MEKPRITLDSVSIAHRARKHHAHRRDLSAARVQRHVIRRSAVPQHRQPRVRLGKPTSGDAYVHWHDYLDIADLHKQPKSPIASRVDNGYEPADEPAPHHETVSEMFDRYRHVAENVNDKLNQLLGDLSPLSSKPAKFQVESEHVTAPQAFEFIEQRMVGHEIIGTIDD